jgi:hypothetical protein
MLGTEADSRTAGAIHPLSQSESERREHSTINHSIAEALNESKLNNSNRYPHNLNITQLIIIDLKYLSPL